MRFYHQETACQGRTARVLLLAGLVLLLEPLAACYCGCDPAGEPCEPTGKGASGCGYGICIHKCGNGAVVNVCAGRECGESACPSGKECIQVSENTMRCVPMGLCSNYDGARTAGQQLVIFIADGWTPRLDR